MTEEEAKKKISARMQRNSDQQLLQILEYKRKDYQPMAIEIAEAELAKRIKKGLDIDAVRLEAQKQFDKDRKLAAASLEWPKRIICFLLPPAARWVASNFLETGESRKFKQAWSFAVAGAIVWGVVVWLVV